MLYTPETIISRNSQHLMISILRSRAAGANVAAAEKFSFEDLALVAKPVSQSFYGTEISKRVLRTLVETIRF